MTAMYTHSLGKAQIAASTRTAPTSQTAIDAVATSWRPRFGNGSSRQPANVAARALPRVDAGERREQGKRVSADDFGIAFAEVVVQAVAVAENRSRDRPKP